MNQLPQTAKPTQQYDDRQGDVSRDYAGPGGFSLYALERMLRDCMEQPGWRARADLCAAYYDGRQLSPLQMEHARREGLEERSINLIKPVINSVLGQEAKARTDIKITADDDADTDVATVVSMRMKEAERETLAHMAVSNAYASMVKTGIGWVHISRNTDPLAYPYRVESVHRNEIWWDWRGQKDVTLLDGCRWLVRKRFLDLDELQARMPEHSDVLARAVDGWDGMLAEGSMVGEPSDRLVSAFYSERRFNLTVPKHDWCDSARKMIKVYEVWYRVPAVVAVLHVSPTRKVQYDPTDPRHVEAVSRGLVPVSKAITSQVRMALYAGPYRLMDIATTKRNFPYVPFFAFRDDYDKSPYGMIDGMIAPQDEYNERRLRIQWMLKARQITIENDALDEQFNTIADVAEGAMRPDFMTVLSSTRKNLSGSGVSIKNDLQMQPEQFNVMADSKQLIQDTAGRYSSNLGQRPSGVTSGIANSILVEQGEQSMGEMNDNYTFGRRSVFEQITEFIVEDHKAANLPVAIGNGKTRRVVVLNSFDPQGQPINQVKDALVKTGMAEIPSTPAVRSQQQQSLATIIQALSGNPKAVAVLAPSFIEATDLDNRADVANDLRKVSGLPIPGDKAGQEKADMMAEKAAEQEMANKNALEQAGIRKATEDANRAAAATRLANAQASVIERSIEAGNDIHKDMATIAKTVSAAQLDEFKAGQQVFDAPNDDQTINNALAEALA